MVSRPFYVFLYMAAPSILIVEDDGIIARQMESKLDALGYEVLGLLFQVSGASLPGFEEVQNRING